MKFAKLLCVAALAAASIATSATASTYSAYSNVRDGTFDDAANTHTTGDTHSVWFSGGSNPTGASGTAANHFLFEFSSAGKGLFEVNGDMAKLTGDVKNENGQGFSLEMNLTRILDISGLAQKKVAGASDADWTYWDLDIAKTNALTSLSDPGLGDFDISLRGSVNNQPLKVQLGTGANDKDADLFGLSSWITFTRTDCSTSCPSYAGDINITLVSAPLPAGMLLLPAGLVLLGGLKRRRKAA